MVKAALSLLIAPTKMSQVRDRYDAGFMFRGYTKDLE